MFGVNTYFIYLYILGHAKHFLHELGSQAEKVLEGAD